MNKNELKTMVETMAAVISTVALLCYWSKARIKQEKKLKEIIESKVRSNV